MARSCDRVPLEVPVRLYGMDTSGKPFNIIARTKDISLNGVRLNGIELALQVGEIVGLQYGIEKARCRVVWVGEAGDRKGQVGIAMLQPSARFWGIKFENKPDTGSPLRKLAASVTPARVEERRQSRRYSCNIGTELTTEGAEGTTWGHCTDVSAGGCYIETRAPLPVGARLRVRFRTEITAFQAECLVCSSHPLLGMGLHFQKLSKDDTRALSKLLLLGAAHDPSVGAPAAGAPVTAAPEMAKLHQIAMTLDAIADSAGECLTDLGALTAFRQVLHAAKALAGDVEDAFRHNPMQVSEAMPMAVLKHRTRLLGEIAKDLSKEKSYVRCEQTDVEQIRGVLQSMEQNLKHLLPVRREEVSRPLPREVIEFPATSTAL